MEKRIEMDASTWSDVESIIQDVYSEEIELLSEKELSDILSSTIAGNEFAIVSGDMNMMADENIYSLVQIGIGAIGILLSYFKIEYNKKITPEIDYVDVFITDAEVTKNMSRRMLLELIERKDDINTAIRRYKTNRR